MLFFQVCRAIIFLGYRLYSEAGMKKNLSVLLKCVVGVLFVGLLIGGFIAYFMTSYDQPNDVYRDGFGRAKSETPGLVRFIFGQESTWTGWFWFIGDMVIFWGGLYLCLFLVNYAKKLAGEEY